MSYVEILILRRLRSGPAHGYELRKRVEQTTGFVPVLALLTGVSLVRRRGRRR